MRFIDLVHGYPLPDERRRFDVEVWVLDAGTGPVLPYLFQPHPDGFGLPRLEIRAVDRVPSEVACSAWRKEVRTKLAEDWDDDDGYAEKLAWVAEQLMTFEEAAALAEWISDSFGGGLVPDVRFWPMLSPDQTQLAVAERSWPLAEVAGYPLTFPTFAETSWLRW